jgi:hypothetical protein
VASAWSISRRGQGRIAQSRRAIVVVYTCKATTYHCATVVDARRTQRPPTIECALDPMVWEPDVWRGEEEPNSGAP